MKTNALKYTIYALWNSCEMFVFFFIFSVLRSNNLYIIRLSHFFSFSICCIYFKLRINQTWKNWYPNIVWRKDTQWRLLFIYFFLHSEIPSRSIWHSNQMKSERRKRRKEKKIYRIETAQRVKEIVCRLIEMNVSELNTSVHGLTLMCVIVYLIRNSFHEFYIKIAILATFRNSYISWYLPGHNFTLNKKTDVRHTSSNQTKNLI